MRPTQPPTVPGSRRPAVLLVDDDLPVVELLTRWLQRERDVIVHTAHDGPAALALAATIPLDAVFTDIELVDESGVDLVRLMMLIQPGLPLCFMSAKMSEEQALGALFVEVSGFLKKPVRSNAFIARLDAMLAR